MMIKAEQSPARGGCSFFLNPLKLRLRGWRGQAPRQPGQIRKEAAVTSPAWVVVQPLTFFSISKGGARPALLLGRFDGAGPDSAQMRQRQISG